MKLGLNLFDGAGSLTVEKQSSAKTSRNSRRPTVRRRRFTHWEFHSYPRRLHSSSSSTHFLFPSNPKNDVSYSHDTKTEMIRTTAYSQKTMIKTTASALAWFSFSSCSERRRKVFLFVLFSLKKKTILRGDDETKAEKACMWVCL